MMYLGVNMLSGVPPIESTGMQQVFKYRMTSDPFTFTMRAKQEYFVPDDLLVTEPLYVCETSDVAQSSTRTSTTSSLQTQSSEKSDGVDF